jgi:hypothetical protein
MFSSVKRLGAAGPLAKVAAMGILGWVIVAVNDEQCRQASTTPGICLLVMLLPKFCST